MMKYFSAMTAERHAARILESFLREIPNLDLKRLERQPPAGPDAGCDIVAVVRFAGRPLTLTVEVKSSGQPRIVRDAATKLKKFTENRKEESIPVFMAPHLSERAQAVCKEIGVGYIDFLGNANIAFDTIYIDRRVAGRPEPDRRTLRSVFQPKSARIVRSMLREPGRHWRVADLAERAKVSFGLVSTVSTLMRERGWAEKAGSGLTLVDPEDLLDSWAEVYEPPRGEELRLYTPLHGAPLIEKLREVRPEKGRVALASFSAAEWLAPFVRQGTTYLYADETGLAALEKCLSLGPAEKGANVIVRVPDEDGVLDDAVSVAEGIVATSPVQTYLDLMQGGERGREGAQHLRSTMLGWAP